jgi:CRP-like cAMP-binding protein
MIRNLAIASPEHRIANVLIKLADEQDGNGPVKILLRRQDIAEMASLTTETTIRSIRRLADQKLVRIVQGKIIIDDVEPLHRFARS